MNNLWRKSFMAGILSVSLTAGAVTPAFASAAPDGKTDAASLAGGMEFPGTGNPGKQSGKLLRMTGLRFHLLQALTLAS